MLDPETGKVNTQRSIQDTLIETIMHNTLDQETGKESIPHITKELMPKGLLETIQNNMQEIEHTLANIVNNLKVRLTRLMLV